MEGMGKEDAVYFDSLCLLGSFRYKNLFTGGTGSFESRPLILTSNSI